MTGGLYASSAASRNEVEDFFYREAAILDAWKLDAWLELFEPGATYEIPSLDNPEGDCRSSQFFIADDMDLLLARVRRLQSKHAHAENPRSQTHRVITNLQVRPAGEALVEATAAFMIHRLRDGRVDPYLGRYEHLLVLDDGSFRFRRRRAILAYERLTPASRLSFIL